MVVPKRSVAPLVLLLAFGAACDPAPENTVFQSSGALCLVSKPDGSVRVRVTFPGCLSSSCDHPVVALCQIKLQDGTVRVSSRGEVEHEGGACTDDCGSFTADCESAPIPPGTYPLVYGTAGSNVTLPANLPTRIFSADNGLESCPP